METILAIFERVPDTRQEWKIKHKLSEILVIALLAITSNAESSSQIHDFAVSRAEWLKTFLMLENGIPGRLTFARVLQALSPKVFAIFFSELMATAEAKTDGRVVAVDGKALAGTYHNDGRKGLVYMVSAWCCENKLTLGQVKTQEKSNEITAIPELLDLLDLKGAVVTMDAIGCQKEIVKKIVKEKKADYVIGLKGNQGTMHREFKEYALAAINEPAENNRYEKMTVTEKGHGRIEEREYWLFRDVEWFENIKEWTGLNGLLMTRSRRKNIKSGKESDPETRFYITSMKGDVEQVARASRSHWGIENNLHWVLDVGFGEDACMTRMNIEAANLSQLRRISVNILNLDTETKMSVKRKRFRCSLELDYLNKLVVGCGLFS